MKARIRFKSIRTSMIIYFSLLVLLTVTVFMFFSIRYTKNNLTENSKKNSRLLIEQVNFNIENYIDYMENISQVVMSNRDMTSYLFDQDTKETGSDLKEAFQTILHARTDIYNIAVLGDNGRYFINNGTDILNLRSRLAQKEWYLDARKEGSGILISSSHVQNLVKDDYKWVVTLSRGITNPETGKVEGLLVIDLNYDVINDLCESITLGNKGYVYIIDRKGEIVYHPQQQLILSGVKKELLKEVSNGGTSISHTDENGENKIYTPFHSNKTGWTIVGVVYTSELAGDEKEVRAMYIGAACTLILFASILAVLLSARITRPIKQLQAAMKEVQQGKFEQVYIDTGGENEISSLTRSFNKMTERIEELMKNNRKEQAEKRKSELKALQSQINPHFLYNTLDSIIWLIETEDLSQAIKMTSVLARFFRQAIGNSKIYVSVWQELEYTRNYLLIQQMRYKDKVAFRILVDEDVMECAIVKLVLQPLVENALYHGLKYKTTQGNIIITGGREGDFVILKIQDDGIGMSKEALASVFKEKVSDKRHNGVGMKNIEDRLKMHYGPDYGLFVESEEGRGTTVTVTIPFKRMEETDEET
ncbi:MAG: sensor histidine kinase [Clostridiales bacterium]|nr:sensor histidine kinase [Clostridiales bacterium]